VLSHSIVFKEGKMALMDNKLLALKEKIVQPGRALSRRAFTRAAIMAPVAGTLAAGSWLAHPASAFAAAHVPAHRVHIDASVQNFHIINDQLALVEGDDGSLWLVSGPFGIVPPARSQLLWGGPGGPVQPVENRLDFQFLSNTLVVVLDDFPDNLKFVSLTNGIWDHINIDFHVNSFQALSADQILVQGNDGKLWLEHGPFGTVPPARVQIDANVQSFHALSADQILVRGNDNKLWLDHGPFGSVPPGRVQIDANVASFQALSTNQVLVKGLFDNRLWLTHGPFGSIPPARTLIDANVDRFQALSADQVFVQGTDRKLWLTHGPFGSVPPARVQIDTDVKDFEALSSTQVAVRGTDDNLWLVSAPFS
jgi:hypothetical protein